MLNFNGIRVVIDGNKSVEDDGDKIEKIAKEEAREYSDKELLATNPAQMVIKKSHLAMGLAATAAIGAGVVWILSSGKINKLISELNKFKNSYPYSELNRLTASEQDLIELDKTNKNIIQILQKEIEELQERIKNYIAIPQATQDAIDARVQFYRKLIDGTSSIYEDAIVPEERKAYAKSFKYKIPFGESTFTTGNKNQTFFAKDLIEKFKKDGSLSISRQNARIAPSKEAIEGAMLQAKELTDLGRKKSDITVAYGKRTGWSDEKIARDVLQNFYDGGNFTLDGTSLKITKLNNGKYSVVIEGDSVFGYSDIRFFGSGKKLENPYSAGGFGEGAKVVIANLLGKGYMKEIKFKSADWECIFDAEDDIVMRTLKQVPEIKQGNSLEFETDNENFITSLIKAMDFFKHKSNPDFENLTYENPNFGFRVLQSGQKGNFYLTQRFEYKNEGAWEDGVEGLNLVFKRKPDFEEFEKITGKKFDTGRDRKPMSAEDVYNLIKYFAKDMSDEDLAQTILSTKAHWKGFANSDYNAIKAMLKALCEIAEKRGVGIDFEGEKICALGQYASQASIRAVQNLGYTIISDKDVPFDKIGMKTVSDIFSMSSQHIALKPTAKEAKKMKILEEATRVVQQGFNDIYVPKARDLISKISVEDLILPKGTTYHIDSVIWKNMTVAPEVAIKNGAFIEILDEEKFAQALYDYIKEYANNMTSIDASKKTFSSICRVLNANKEKNPALEQIIVQLKNLNIIAKSDVAAPRFIFDRKNEIAKGTLGEAITGYNECYEHVYKGHWIDRTHLNQASFSELLATWLHEICHKSGGDGTSEFTYKLTDMIEGLIDVSIVSPQYQADLLALEKIFNEIK